MRKTGLTFQFEPLFDSENLPNTVYTSKFQGFIHPLGAASSNGPPLKVFLVSVAADAQLYLSTDSTKQNKVSPLYIVYDIFRLWHCYLVTVYVFWKP